MSKNINESYIPVTSIDKTNRKNGRMNAWLYFRKSVHHIPEDIGEQMEAFRKKCRERGYNIIGETFSFGDSLSSGQTIEKIIASEAAVNYILSPTLTTLSGNTQEFIELTRRLYEHGILFKSANSGFALVNPMLVF